MKVAAPKKKRGPQKDKKYCVETGCRQMAASSGYCRLHYLANHSTIKLSQKIKAEKRLNAFVDRLAKKYPKDYLEKLKEGLEDENKFKETVQELDMEPAGGENPETDKEFLEKFMRIIKPGG
jgi:hypothetical protein